MNINITDQERQLLVRIVEQYYLTLREEIYKTEAFEFKDKLKVEEAAIENLLEKLRAAGGK